MKYLLSRFSFIKIIIPILIARMGKKYFTFMLFYDYYYFCVVIISSKALQHSKKYYT